MNNISPKELADLASKYAEEKGYRTGDCLIAGLAYIDGWCDSLRATEEQEEQEATDDD